MLYGGGGYLNTGDTRKLSSSSLSELPQICYGNEALHCTAQLFPYYQHKMQWRQRFFNK